MCGETQGPARSGPFVYGRAISVHQAHEAIIGWKTTITADSSLTATCEELTEIRERLLAIFNLALMNFYAPQWYLKRPGQSDDFAVLRLNEPGTTVKLNGRGSILR